MEAESKLLERLAIEHSEPTDVCASKRSSFGVLRSDVGFCAVIRF